MCLMAPMRVVSVDGTTCEIESGGRIDRASMVLEPDLEVGDWVLVNSGTVVRRLDADQAEEMSRAIEDPLHDMIDSTPSPQSTSLTGPPSPGVHAAGHHPRGVSPPSGPVLFARYAFGPNRLGLCGPEDWRSLLELGVAGAAEAGSRALEIDRGLRDLAARFEGAYPYLQLIAAAHGIADPMDRRVVDAYWIGNQLSDRVDPGLLRRSMSDQFEAQLPADAWRWLAGKPEAGAHPTHAFHVLDVFPRVGLMRNGAVADVVGLIDSCRIRWGRCSRSAVTGSWWRPSPSAWWTAS